MEDNILRNLGIKEWLRRRRGLFCVYGSMEIRRSYAQPSLPPKLRRKKNIRRRYGLRSHRNHGNHRKGCAQLPKFLLWQASLWAERLNSLDNIFYGEMEIRSSPWWKIFTLTPLRIRFFEWGAWWNAYEPVLRGVVSAFFTLLLSYGLIDP